MTDEDDGVPEPHEHEEVDLVPYGEGETGTEDYDEKPPRATDTIGGENMSDLDEFNDSLYAATQAVEAGVMDAKDAYDQLVEKHGDAVARYEDLGHDVRDMIDEGEQYISDIERSIDELGRAGSEAITRTNDQEDRMDSVDRMLGR